MLQESAIAKAIAAKGQRSETEGLLRENFSERSCIVQTSGAHYDMFTWISNNGEWPLKLPAKTTS